MLLTIPRGRGYNICINCKVLTVYNFLGGKEYEQQKHKKGACFKRDCNGAAMLVGTTFAWFTDTASTSVNTIRSGSLDVALEMQKADGTWENAEGKTLDFKKAAGAEAEKILWEPGCRHNPK